MSISKTLDIVEFTATHTLVAGHLVVELTDSLRIEVLPASAGPTEAWRLAAIGGEHLVYPPE